MPSTSPALAPLAQRIVLPKVADYSPAPYLYPKTRCRGHTAIDLTLAGVANHDKTTEMSPSPRPSSHVPPCG